MRKRVCGWGEGRSAVGVWGRTYAEASVSSSRQTAKKGAIDLKSGD